MNAASSVERTAWADTVRSLSTESERLAVARDGLRSLSERGRQDSADALALAVIIADIEPRKGAPTAEWSQADFVKAQRWEIDNLERARREGDVPAATLARQRLDQLAAALPEAELVWARRPAIVAQNRRVREAALKREQEAAAAERARVDAAAGALSNALEQLYALTAGAKPRPSVAVLRRAHELAAARLKVGLPQLCMGIQDWALRPAIW